MNTMIKYKLVLITEFLESNTKSVLGEYSSMADLLSELKDVCSDLLLLPTSQTDKSIAIETTNGGNLYCLSLRTIATRLKNNEPIIK